MSEQLDIFGNRRPFAALSGEVLKQSGIKKVTANNREWIDWIRAKAAQIALKAGVVSADDLRNVAVAHGREPAHPNAWGAVFRGSDWEIVGRKKSATPSAHSRTINVYRLRGVSK